MKNLMKQAVKSFEEKYVFRTDLYVSFLVKESELGVEYYIFIHSTEHRAEMLRTPGRFASDPELHFTRYDAAVLSQKIRKITEDDKRIRE